MDDNINEIGEDISPNLDKGVLKKTLRSVEDGECPMEGDQVWVHYGGMLDDGCDTIFDTSRRREEDQPVEEPPEPDDITGWVCTWKARTSGTGEPFSFNLGKGEDISVEKDLSLMKHLLEKGDGWQHPEEGADVTIAITGRYDNQEFDNRTVSFIFDDEIEENLVPGIKMALKYLKENEKARLTIDHKYAFGTQGSPEFGIPPEARIEYDVKLLSFENPKEPWQMETKERLEQAKSHHEKGNKLQREKDYEKAVKCYKWVIALLEDLSAKNEGARSRVLRAFTDVAQVYLDQERWEDAKDYCNRALRLDSRCVKAYQRRAKVHEETEMWNDAREDYEKILEIVPQNKTAKKALEVVKEKLPQRPNVEKRITQKRGKKIKDKAVLKLARNLGLM